MLSYAEVYFCHSSICHRIWVGRVGGMEPVNNSEMVRDRPYMSMGELSIAPILDHSNPPNQKFEKSHFQISTSCRLTKMSIEHILG